MAVFNLENNNKWGASSVYDATLQKSQEEINAEADTALQPAQVDTTTINALAALIVPANDGKVLGVVDGALAAVSGGAAYPDGDGVSY